jgi:hypothetical protein
MTVHPDWSPAALAAARQRADPLAQAAVDAVFAEGGGLEGGTRCVGALMQELIHRDGLPVDALPPAVQRFLAESAAVPAWVDEAKLRRGEQLFMEHGVLSLASLLHASLPECYLMERGVHVLWMTQRLEVHVFRRLIETAQMVVSVMSPGGIRVEGGRLTGVGIEVTQKVRLLHESMRHLILLAPAGTPDAPAATTLSEVMAGAAWDRAALGLPINQEDMAYTLLTFGHVIPRSLRTLGVPLSDEDHEAMLHAWNVAGVVMGVEESLLAHSKADAERLYAAIQATQAAPSGMASAMTRSLLDVVREELPWHRATYWLPPLLVEVLCGRRVARMLDLQRPGTLAWLVYAPLLALLRVVLRLEQALLGSDRVWQGLLTRLGEDTVQLLARLPRGQKDISFDIPRDVAVAWGLVGR